MPGTTPKTNWRIQFAPVGAETVLAISEIEFRTAPGGTAYTAGMSIQTDAGGHIPELIDANTATEWVATPSNYLNEDWGGTVVDVLEIAITASLTTPQDAPKSFTVSHINSSFVFVPVITITDTAPWSAGEQRTYALYPVPVFGITGAITETIAATDFFVRASQLDTGAFIADAVMQGDTTYAFDFGAIVGYETYTDEVLIIALPKTGKRRLDSTAYALDDYYLPADVTTNDHIYKVTVAGTTAASEPVLDQAGGATVDGSVTVQDMGPTPTPKTRITYAANY